MSVVLEIFSGVTVSDDVEEADWLRASLRPETHGRSSSVATLVPAAYPAHGRILHRASRGLADLSWAEVAAMTGRRLHAETQYGEMIGWQRDPDDQMPPDPWGQPEQGRLLPEECAAVAEVLARYPTTPDDCWFCLWEGYGWPELERLRARAGFIPADYGGFEPGVEDDGATRAALFAADDGGIDPEAHHEMATPGLFPSPVPIAPQVSLQSRVCILFRGPVTAATAFRSEPMYQSPTLWWPADRAWCVASELDIYSTYVAAEPPALRALIDHPALEVLECDPEHGIDRGQP